MRLISRRAVIPLIILITGAFPFFAAEAQESDSDVSRGKTIFKRTCQWCHGALGNGKGPAAFFLGAYSAPRPRDFTVGNFKFRSTPADNFPTDQDFFRTITNGIPGFMPSFSSLSIKDRWAVVQFVKSLSSMESGTARKIIVIKGPPIPFTPESIVKGQQVFYDLQCHTCHGDNGRGNGKIALAGKLKDSRDLPISPTDLTNRYAYKNGATRRDIVRTLLTGIVGTPMPSYDGQFENGQADAWHVANFLLSLSPSPFNANPS